MRYAICGLRGGSADEAGSVSGFIRIGRRGILRTVFVKHRLAHHIFLAGPIPKVEHPAALAAKRKIRVRLRIGRLTANWTISFHRRFFLRCHPEPPFRGEGSAFASCEPASPQRASAGEMETKLFRIASSPGSRVNATRSNSITRPSKS